ncbi:MAG: hypothetical protein JW837_07175 [Sedimentisphaerales bacterium]|nr:hypothetical protein [Sedimentisphaerales bacterium]
MFTLIKREIRDHIVYLILAACLAGIFILISVPVVSRYNSSQDRGSSDSQAVIMGVGIPASIIVILGICGLGAAQMYLDRTRKISAFLSTLAVSRGRILIARIATGILVILTFLLPLIGTVVILFRLFVPPILFSGGMIFEIFLTIFLMVFACYCIGLQTGWNSNPITPSLGGLFLTGIFIPLVLIKGFGLQVVVILALFIVASLIRIWHTFTTTSL